MKRIPIAMLFGFLIAVLCACSPETGEYRADGMSDRSGELTVEAEETDKADEAGPDLPSPDCSYSERYLFYSEEELCAGIRSGEGDDEALLSLTEYYRPKTPGPDLVLSEIAVKDAYVALRYDIKAKEDAEGDPDVYWLFEWYRKLRPQSLKDELTRVFDPGAVKQMDGFFYVEGGVLQDVFWEQDGNLFHAVTPAELSSSQLRAFCELERVPIPQQEP